MFRIQAIHVVSGRNVEYITLSPNMRRSAAFRAVEALNSGLGPGPWEEITDAFAYRLDESLDGGKSWYVAALTAPQEA